jgi:hypothetical protein
LKILASPSQCIYRRPNECKERHKLLTDKSCDGADSADDSGSSQHYPSALPGIPKVNSHLLFLLFYFSACIWK